MNTFDKKRPIEIVCGLDSAYAPHLAVMLKSVTKYNSTEDLRIHIIHDSIDKALRNKVESCLPDLEIHWYEVINHRALAFEPLLQITRATYLRLTMLEVLSPEISQIIFLDVDIIVNSNLLPLWNTQLGDNICAAVIDPGVNVQEFAKKWCLSEQGQYFNAGVMVINLNKLRQEPLLQRAIEILSNPQTPCELADQDALNVVFWGQWIAVDPAWNFQRKFLYNNGAAWKGLNPAARSGPLIIHFT